MVLNSSNPKDSMIKGPKVEIPPLGILVIDQLNKLNNFGKGSYEIENINANQIQDLTSRHASLAWSHFHLSLSIPCWFMRSLMGMSVSLPRLRAHVVTSQ